ncbi:hypothetical protein [Sorangium sp. So ce233]|uniref:hypothetical protein n=1 Tax=Sorangium sp. So ce233 TaxID=3133290 RepID=UPI003F5E53C2
MVRPLWNPAAGVYLILLRPFKKIPLHAASRGLGERLRRRGSERRGPPAPGPPLRHGR